MIAPLELASCIITDIPKLGASLKRVFLAIMVLKTKSSKDTISGYKKIKIIDALSINGNYNFLADSMKLSNLNLSMRLSPVSFISIVATSVISPYAWDINSGKTLNAYAYQENNRLGRILSSSINTTWILTTKEGKRKITDNKQVFTSVFNSDIQYYSMYPERFIDFEIPWKVNVTHVFSMQVNTNKLLPTSNEFTTIQTLSVNGDVSFTKRWKISGTSYYDIKSNQITTE